MTTDPRQFAIVEYWGNTPPKHSHATGSWAEICEHIPDSKTVRQKLAIINDAAHAEGKLKSIRDRERRVAARERAVTEREDAVTARELAHAISKLDALATHLDSIEERQRIANEEPITLPPGLTADEGELQVSKAHDEHLKSEPSDDDDGDPGAVLPQAPIPPSDVHYTQDPDPVSTLNLSVEE